MFFYLYKYDCHEQSIKEFGEKYKFKDLSNSSLLKYKEVTITF